MARLEILNYDVLGSTALHVTMRRRALFESDPSLPVPLGSDGKPTVAVDENGVATKMVEPPGPSTLLAIGFDDVTPDVWKRLLGAFKKIEDTVSEVAEARYASLETDATVLDEKIAAAEEAKRTHEEVSAALTAKRAELAQLAVTQEAPAVLTKPTKTKAKKAPEKPEKKRAAKKK